MEIARRSREMENTEIGCVVFDIDDTLYLERDYIRSGFDAVGVWAATEWRIVDFANLAWKAFEFGERRTIFDSLLAAQGIDSTPDKIARLVEVYREHRPRIELLPDARRCLHSLYGRVPLAVITDGPRASQAAKIEALILRKWISPIILTDDLGTGYGKPHPMSFQLVEQQVGVDGSRCLYVADNPAKDFQGARARGWRTARVRRPGGLHHAVEATGVCDLEIEDLDALRSVLDEALSRGIKRC